MRSLIEKILEIAIHTPSGDNCQPWEFRFRENKLFVSNVPERDRSLYNWHQNASLVAQGALLENITVTASSLGYSTSLDVLPNWPNDNLVAQIAFTPGPQNDSGLAQFVLRRSTNRYPYKNRQLHEQEINALINEKASSFSGNSRTKLILITDPKNVEILGELAAINEKVVFENKLLHKFLIDHINWTINENNERKLGFYIRDLGVAAVEVPLFKSLSNWNFLSALNKLGISNFIAKKNGKTYSRSSAVGFIITDGNTANDYLATGALLERIWLRATSLNLSLQPLTGVLFLFYRILLDQNIDLSLEHKILVRKTYSRICSVAGVSDRNILMMFRIGEAHPSVAHSLKLPPKINS